METTRGTGFDVVGVGFGPSNLGLAVAIEEHNQQVAQAGGSPLTGMFFERRPAFAWHSGMLLPNANVQVSFLKDLATMRNPASTFSFVAYLHDRVWHSSDLLPGVEELAGERAPRRFVVVGAGQSAAEATEFLCSRFPDAEICAVFARFGYSPSDDSSFTNRIFDPSAVDTFYSAPEDVKQMLAGYHRNTNYSVVDAELIDALYRRVYTDKVLGRQRLRVMQASRVVDLEETAKSVRAVVEHLPDGE